jgi:hypothetical protein
MNKRFFTIAYIIAFSSITAFSQQITPQKIIPGEWIRTWLLCGPIPLQEQQDPSLSAEHLQGFQTDYLKKAGGEQNPHINAGDAVKFKGGSAKWFLFSSHDSIIDLDNAVSKKDRVLAYAYTEIEADNSGIWFLSLGSNDGGSLWVNSLKAWDCSCSRGLSADDDIIPVPLNKGINKILLKIEDRGNRWGFCVRFLPFSPDMLEKSGFLFSVTTALDGEAGLSSRLSLPVLQQLIQKIDIRVSDRQQKVVLKEERTKDFSGKIALSPDDFQSYTADLRISLNSGQVLDQKIDFKAGKRTDYTLFSNGKSEYRIALGRDASESEKWAANELQHWISEISGAEIPVEDIERPYAGPQIIIGYNDLVRQLTAIRS